MSGGFFPSIENFAKGVATTAAGLSTVGLGLAWYGQNYLIYPSSFPAGSRTEVPSPADFGLPYEDLVLTTPDNVVLRSYLLVQHRELEGRSTHLDTSAFSTDAAFAASRPTVMMFHGNGGNCGHRLPLAKVFYAKMRCNVLLLSYRGYGKSDGDPSETGLRLDAQTALNHILAHETLSRTKIILFGQSIGGAVAIDLASRNPQSVHALILENTFLSMPKMVPHALPILGPFSFLCHQKWDSESRMPLIPARTPILMLSGSQDEIVPPSHMRDLWEIARQRGNTQKAAAHDIEVGIFRSKLLEFPNGQHNDTCIQENYWTAVAEFIAEVCK